ncbi:hypothetical protein LX32DRAFT_728810 [Colletotrichum zoysiae]|uniref:Uncharacterized protein n=1 Tax=Colletotrichum zoysiae TaxID=1216348 RepID=A0AAD9M0M4_9PEZI|nr:hypothetical protein LX32DRAFT_728810 [Colletotrichum zoysiae]
MPDGGFYHRRPIYIEWLWLDGVSMLNVFYARWTRGFEPGNATAWDDIALNDLEGVVRFLFSSHEYELHLEA